MLSSKNDEENINIGGEGAIQGNLPRMNNPSLARNNSTDFSKHTDVLGLKDQQNSIVNHRTDLDKFLDKIPSDILYKSLLFSRPSLLISGQDNKRLRNCYNSHTKLWNHLINSDPNVGYKEIPIDKCKAQLYDRIMKIKVLKLNNGLLRSKNCHRMFADRLCSLRLTTFQSDMTMLKVINNKIFTTSDDKTLKVFDIRELENFRKEKTESMDESIDYNGIGMESFGTNDKSVKFEDEFECRVGVATFTGHFGGIWALDTDGESIVTGSTDKSVKLLRYNEDSPRFNINDIDYNAKENISLIASDNSHTATVRVVLLTPDYIISGARDSTITIFDRSLRVLSTLREHKDSVKCLAANDKYLVSGSYDYRVCLFALPPAGSKSEEFKLIRVLQHHNHRIFVVKIFRNYVAAAGLLGIVKITNIKNIPKNHFNTVEYDLHNACIPWIEFCDNHIISGSINGIVVKYDYIAKKEVWIKRLDYPIKCIKLKDGLLVIGTCGGGVDVCEVESGKLIKNLAPLADVTKVDVVDKWIVVGTITNGNSNNVSNYISLYSIDSIESKSNA